MAQKIGLLHKTDFNKEEFVEKTLNWLVEYNLMFYKTIVPIIEKYKKANT